MNRYDRVKVVAIRDDRFATTEPGFKRHPRVGDVGVILEIYQNPTRAFEVECCELGSPETLWLEAMFPEELSAQSNKNI